MRVGVYPGTFDPVTLGHMDIIGRGARRASHAGYDFDTVVCFQLLGPGERRKRKDDEDLDCVKLLARLCSVEALEGDGGSFCEALRGSG